jgi:hypothetical protein
MRVADARIAELLASCRKIKIIKETVFRRKCYSVRSPEFWNEE